MTIRRKKVAVLISGRGSNLVSLIEASSDQDFPAEIGLVVSNNPNAPGLDFARKHGIETHAVDHRNFSSREAFDRSMNDVLLTSKIEIVCLAGFMRLVSKFFVNEWKERLLNIHPSLLPSFVGLNTHRRALESGVKIHGCTVHFVTEDLDAGPIIMQGAVPVFDDDDEDTLAAKVLKVEHEIYPQALAMVAQEEISIHENRVLGGGKIRENDSFVFPNFET